MSSKIIVFNHGYIPKTGVIRLKGTMGYWVTNRFGQCVVDNTVPNLKIIEASHLRYWIPPEELTPEELQLNHLERWEAEQRRKEKQREDEEI